MSSNMSRGCIIIPLNTIKDSVVFIITFVCDVFMYECQKIGVIFI